MARTTRGGVGDARRLGEGLDERGEVDVVVESEDGNHLGRRATRGAPRGPRRGARHESASRGARAQPCCRRRRRSAERVGGGRGQTLRRKEAQGPRWGGRVPRATTAERSGTAAAAAGVGAHLMVRRCAGPSSPATLCLPRVDLEAWRPVLCFLLRWPWPEGAGIVADCSPSRAPPNDENRRLQARAAAEARASRRESGTRVRRSIRRGSS